MLNKQLIALEQKLGSSILEKIDEPFIQDQGIELWLKRDDLLHEVISGNKWRKLKYILDHALSLKTQKVISMGGAYSNHLHALAYVGNNLDIKTEAKIRGERPKVLNPTLVDLFEWGMTVEFVLRSEYRQLRTYKEYNTLPGLQAGEYWLPEGGAMNLALSGVAELVNEIEIDYDVLCVPCGTATTLAGIINAVPETKQVIGFSALKGAGFLSSDVQQMLKNKSCQNKSWLIELDYHFGGFAKVNPALLDFIKHFEQTHNIQLEPIYTGKMLYGIYNLIKQGFFKPGQRIIAVHTGGLQGNRGFVSHKRDQIMTETKDNTETQEALSLDNPAYYYNRELSLLEFNDRVLAQAKDENIPLLERLNYLCISCSNLDEFYEVRVASVIQMAEMDPHVTASDGLNAQEQLKVIAVKAHKLVNEQYRVLHDLMIPELAEQNIRFIRRDDWTEEQRQWLKKFFHEELRPILTPVGLDSAHPFPRILNKSLNFIISLTGKDAFGRNSGRAILQAPRALPRIIPLPSEETEGGEHDFVFLSSIIHAFVEELFNGMTVKHCHQFRVTRNSDLYVDDDAIDDLLNAVEGELAMRNYGDEVRMEIDTKCTEETVNFLAARFGITDDQVFLVNGPVNLSRVQEIVALVDRPDLKFTPYKASIPTQLSRHKNYFAAIKKQDILLHHPYESFAPVVEFIRQAAVDPDVLAIKQTLYRTSSDSPIINALLKAARAGKEVTVVIELRARFDEKANITLAAKLQDAAVNVVYGVVGYKTHAKMCLVVRKESKKFKDYVHLGTGNYHPKTAQFYTDYGLFSANKELGEDVRKVFVQLTSLGKVTKLNKLLQSPFTLHKGLMAKIEREIECANKGKPAKVIFKVNSVVEEKMIQALYRASQAGVEVRLIVRGICSLRPGIKGISENIEVRSIIGRFLEHTRVYMFENGGSPEVYAASADMMSRNMFRRVEAAFPIENKNLKTRVLNDLDSYLKDNSQAWIMQSDGNYVQCKPEGDIFRVQNELMEQYSVK